MIGALHHALEAPPWGCLPFIAQCSLCEPCTIVPAVGGNAMFSSSYGPPRITYEPLDSEAQDESESDMLPFAIDGDLAQAQEDSRQQLAASRSSGGTGGCI